MKRPLDYLPEPVERLINALRCRLFNVHGRGCRGYTNKRHVDAKGRLRGKWLG